MTANITSIHQNFMPEKKPGETVEKDVRKWVESVCEFKANLEKQKSELPLEKHLKKMKFKIKKKSSSIKITGGVSKNTVNNGQRKNQKTKKISKKIGQMNAEKPAKKELAQSINAFDQIKESYTHLKLPQNWTSGVSNGRLVFNRIKMTTNNSQQKMAVERTLVITKDRNVHVLLNGSEITLNNWEIQKVDTLDDIKKAIKDIDSLKICEGPTRGPKSPQCSFFMDKTLKSCQACSLEVHNSEKLVMKKSRTKKKTKGSKGTPKQKLLQK